MAKPTGGDLKELKPLVRYLGQKPRLAQTLRLQGEAARERDPSRPTDSRTMEHPAGMMSRFHEPGAPGAIGQQARLGSLVSDAFARQLSRARY